MQPATATPPPLEPEHHDHDELARALVRNMAKERKPSWLTVLVATTILGAIITAVGFFVTDTIAHRRAQGVAAVEQAQFNGTVAKSMEQTLKQFEAIQKAQEKTNKTTEELSRSIVEVNGKTLLRWDSNQDAEAMGPVYRRLDSADQLLAYRGLWIASADSRFGQLASRTSVNSHYLELVLKTLDLPAMSELPEVDAPPPNTAPLILGSNP